MTTLCTFVDNDGHLTHKLIGRRFRAEASYVPRRRKRRMFSGELLPGYTESYWYIEAGDRWIEVKQEAVAVDILNTLSHTTPNTLWPQIESLSV